MGAAINLLTDDKLFEKCKENALRFASKLHWDIIYDNSFSTCLGNVNSENSRCMKDARA